MANTVGNFSRSISTVPCTSFNYARMLDNRTGSNSKSSTFIVFAGSSGSIGLLACPPLTSVAAVSTDTHVRGCSCRLYEAEVSAIGAPACVLDTGRRADIDGAFFLSPIAGLKYVWLALACVGDFAQGYIKSSCWRAKYCHVIVLWCAMHTPRHHTASRLSASSPRMCVC